MNTRQSKAHTPRAQDKTGTEHTIPSTPSSSTLLNPARREAKFD